MQYPVEAGDQARRQWDSENFQKVTAAALYALFRTHPKMRELEAEYTHLLSGSGKEAKEASLTGGVPHTTSLLSLLEHAIQKGLKDDAE